MELAKVLPEKISVQIPEPTSVDGEISFLETIVISELIKWYNPKNIFEIGTFNGRTTLSMAANCTEETKIYTLDLPKAKLNSTKLHIDSADKIYIDKENSGTKYLGTTYEDKISQLYGDSATFDFSPFYNKVDFIFIDGSHSYEYVLSDSEQALKLLRNKQGIIIWHDYALHGYGVIKALNELYLESKDFKDLKHICGTTFVCLGID
ncbi:MAG: class I SAM-dependent methyltransferase [Candidatus Omnitrophica bacterium]|nr:class I SAM-dependent methyltransferase [Candidatus Omnitrophota bacterium]